MTAPTRPPLQLDVARPVESADPTFLPTAEAWRAYGRKCFTCGAPAAGTFPDGSPRYDHRHPPIRL